MEQFAVNNTSYCIDCDKPTLEVLTKQLEVRNFGFDSNSKKEFVIAPSAVFGDCSEVGMGYEGVYLPLMLLAKNLDDVTPAKEISRASHFLLHRMLKLYDKRKLVIKETGVGMSAKLNSACAAAGINVGDLSRNFSVYRIRKVFLENARDNAGDFVLELVMENDGEFSSVADCFEQRVIPFITGSNPSLKSLSEYFVNLASIDSDSFEEELQIFFHLQNIAEILLKNEKRRKFKTYNNQDIEAPFFYNSIRTFNFERDLFNDALRFALQGVYSKIWKGPLWKNSEQDVCRERKYEDFLKGLNEKEKKVLDVDYDKYLQTSEWYKKYGLKNQSRREMLGKTETCYLNELSSAKNSGNPFFLKFADVPFFVN
ncbi:hypothetical protein HZA97_09855 [Candidatus Woesearchaeota archaeon]|nr:hypothetical protein [Candidatus Woesearchaeota archaeon]